MQQRSCEMFTSYVAAQQEPVFDLTVSNVLVNTDAPFGILVADQFILASLGMIYILSYKWKPLNTSKCKALCSLEIESRTRERERIKKWTYIPANCFRSFLPNLDSEGQWQRSSSSAGSFSWWIINWDFVLTGLVSQTTLLRTKTVWDSSEAELWKTKSQLFFKGNRMKGYTRASPE